MSYQYQAVVIGSGPAGKDIANLSAVHPSATEILVRILRNHFEQPALVELPNPLQRNENR